MQAVKPGDKINEADDITQKARDSAQFYKSANNVTQWINNRVATASLVPQLSALRAVTVALSGLSVAEVAKAFLETGKAYTRMPQFVEQGTTLAFNPDATFKRRNTSATPSLDQEARHAGRKVNRSRLSEAKNAYLTLLEELVGLAEEGQRDTLVAKYERLPYLGSDIHTSLEKMRYSVSAVSAEARLKDAGFEERALASLEAMLEGSKQRRIMELLLLEYLIDPAFDPALLLAQQVTVTEAIEAAESALVDLSGSIADIQVPAILAITNHEVVPDTSYQRQVYILSATIGNYGQETADSIIVTLAVDSTSAPLFIDFFPFEPLLPGEERDFGWLIVNSDTEKPVGTYTLTPVSEGVVGIGATGFYEVNPDFTATSTEPEPLVESGYSLGQNYPNPFNPVTTITYSVPARQRVKITLYDLLGRKRKTIVDNSVSAGEHVVEFDGSSLPSGVYLYRMEAGPFTQVKRMTLLK